MRTGGIPILGNLHFPHHPIARYELAREKEREEQDALRADEDQRKTIIEEERRRRVVFL